MIYFDNSATTPICRQAAEEQLETVSQKQLDAHRKNCILHQAARQQTTRQSLAQQS